MTLLEKIAQAGIVGCGGAGFPTHAKLNCKVEYFIVNAAECEPLLRTDRYLMIHHAKEIVAAVDQVAKLIKAQKIYIALKETYTREIAALQEAIDRAGSPAQLYRMKNFYPAGDEQIMVCDITGRTVPPSGIPLDVGTVVSNVGTMYAVYEATKGKPLIHKYITVTGEVREPVIVYAPVGTPISLCLQQAGVDLADYVVVVGGPLMGKQYTKEEAQTQVVTKTTSGLIVVPKDIPLVQQKETPLEVILRRAKTSCIQCSSCTELCPRYLTGHPLQPHKIMRKMAYGGDVSEMLEDVDLKQALTCSECGVCETYACPMGLQPRQVNIFVKSQYAKAGIRYQKPTESPTRRPEREFRRIPSKRIANRLGVGKYYDYQIDTLRTVSPNRVEIPVRQHIGAPSTPVVQVGDLVQEGQLIAAAPEKGLGANIHASIGGVVLSVGERIIIEGTQTAS